MTLRAISLTLLSLSLLACGGAQNKGDKSDSKLVPEETQQAARERQGEQQLMMDDLSLTPAERAAARHEARTKPVDNPKYGQDKKK